MGRGRANRLTAAEVDDPTLSEATFRRRHNRRNCDHPINQPKKTANAELSKTPAATPSHCAQIETLAMASRPYRTTPGPRCAQGPLMSR